MKDEEADMKDEIVIKHDMKPKPGWPCPSCHGVGNMMDGSASFSQTETCIRPATKCYLCRGSGRVYVTAINE